MENRDAHLRILLDACRNGKRSGQKKLYQLFYGYAFSIALRYAANRSEAEEILNEGFLKVFTRLDQYDEEYEFKKWLRKIVVNTAIDYHRKYHKQELYPTTTEHISAKESNQGWDNLLFEDVLAQVQQLPPRYRLVFNLYALEGLKHHEIAEQLNISVGTSKSNYAKARRILQQKINHKPVAKLYRDER